MTEGAPLFEVERLTVEAGPARAPVVLVDDVSLRVAAGEALAIVGESGGGKSLAVRAALGLLPPTVREAAGRVRWRGIELAADARPSTLGWEIGYVPQDPGSALDPTQRVGAFVAEGLRFRSQVPKREARQRAVALLDAVGVAEPEARARDFPHRLSVGTRQRVLLAAALAQSPALLVADEPTSAVDATIAVELTQLLARGRAERDRALLVVTHDLGTVAALADRVAVFYAGRIVEAAPVEEFFRAPAHPYSQALLAAVPAPGQPPRSLPGVPPDPARLPVGCAFHPRCPLADPTCTEVPPPLVPIASGHRVACIKARRR